MNSVTHAPLAFDAGLRWQTGYARLGENFFTELPPQPLLDPYWVARSASVASLLGLDDEALSHPDLLEALSGNQPLAGSQPISTVYSGHQFGVWAGQLGDGRALLLGETEEGWEIQLKVVAAPPTPVWAMGVPFCAQAFESFCAVRQCMGWAFPPRGLFASRALIRQFDGKSWRQQRSSPA